MHKKDFVRDENAHSEAGARNICSLKFAGCVAIADITLHVSKKKFRSAMCKALMHSLLAHECKRCNNLFNRDVVILQALQHSVSQRTADESDLRP